MTVLWIIGGLGLLVAIAATIEAWVKRDQHRPLSRLAPNQRRYDDANAPVKDRGATELDVKSYMDGCKSISGKSWKVARDPEEYARVMMPRTDTRTEKGQRK